ncbi:MAG: TetR/AcrR family transcriptional regulator, partial [Stenotrophobium sp.]
ARSLKVTRPVIYSCFQSRDELLTALLDREEQRLFSGVLSALPSMAAVRNPEQLVIEGFQALLKVVSQNLYSWKLVFASSPDPAVADRFAGARKAVAKKVSTLMGPALLVAGTKDVRRKLPVLVEMFMAAGEGAVRALSQSDGKWTPEELGEFVGRIVFAALRKA